jgi:hypothetical protein
MVQHQYFTVAEVNLKADIEIDISDEKVTKNNLNDVAILNIGDKLPDVDEWETFGYDEHLLALAATPEVFGSTAKQALINFYIKYPEHLTIKA